MATPAGSGAAADGVIPAGRANNGRQQPQQQGFGQMMTGIIRMGLFWFIATRMFSAKKPSDPALLMHNVIPKGENLDIWLYISEDDSFNEFGNEKALAWHETNVPYAVWGPDSVRHHHLAYHLSEAVKHNGSVYAHVFLSRSGYTPDPNDPEYDSLSFNKSHPLVIYLPKPKLDKRKSLLAGVNEEQSFPDPLVIPSSIEDAEQESQVEYVSFWKPNLTISLVEDFTRYSRNGLPPHIADNLIVDNTTGNYFPTIYFNEFWLLRDKLVPVNESLKELELNLQISPISLTKWQLFLQIDQSFQIHRKYGSMLEGEADELKRVFLEGNPYLLVLTMCVSLLHTIFDFLAFKNDIQFWNKNKSMEGLSAKSVVVSFICQLVVLLYLLDNQTSWMIIASSGVGCCIEFWKIGKAMHIEIDHSKGFPLLRFRDRDSYAGNKTKEYDDLAMKYLSYVLFLLVICFSIYSLIYERHKSWYSWILSSCTSCVYTFGFIMMCPQLFINYKLKSVAHLPWRQMTYKFLNTIIDDLFAFVIKMPTLHRLSVFRDDVIFLIYLYQRWVYPVDKSRINEFGFGGEAKKEDSDQSSSEAEPFPAIDAKGDDDRADQIVVRRTAAGTAQQSDRVGKTVDSLKESKKSK